MVSWEEATLRRGELLWSRKRRRPGRLKAYTLGGKWVCLPGLGEGKDFGTIPCHWKVSGLTGTACWVEILRAPEAEEGVQEGVHWKFIEPWDWKPTTVLFCHPDGTTTIGGAEDKLHLYDATHLQVIRVIEEKDVAVPDGDSNPSTPPTPVW